MIQSNVTSVLDLYAMSKAMNERIDNMMLQVLGITLGDSAEARKFAKEINREIKERNL